MNHVPLSPCTVQHTGSSLSMGSTETPRAVSTSSLSLQYSNHDGTLPDYCLRLWMNKLYIATLKSSNNVAKGTGFSCPSIAGSAIQNCDAIRPFCQTSRGKRSKFLVAKIFSSVQWIKSVGVQRRTFLVGTTVASVFE